MIGPGRLIPLILVSIGLLAGVLGGFLTRGPVITAAGIEAGGGARGRAGPRVATAVAPEVLYHHQDASGNLVALTDSGGQVAWRADMRPFGQGVASSTDQPLRFLDRPREGDIGAEGGLYHLGARGYDPVAGRFLSPDPLPLTEVKRENPQRFNQYAYALNNPLRYSDPSGFQDQFVFQSFQAAMDWAAATMNNPQTGPYTRLLIKKIVQNAGGTQQGLAALSQLHGIAANGGLSERMSQIAIEIYRDPNFGKDIVAEAKDQIKLERLARRGAPRGGGGTGGFATLGMKLTLLGIAVALHQAQGQFAEGDYTGGITTLSFISPYAAALVLPLTETLPASLDAHKFYRENPDCFLPHVDCRHLAEE